MSNQPKVSIIIPCFQVSDYIRAAVLSALHQSYPVAGIYVISDGCPDSPDDEIIDLLEHDHRLMFWHKENGGVASARNMGLAQIDLDTDYVMFLDGDDVLKPEAISEMVKALTSNPEAGMVHCEPEFIDEMGRVIIDRKWMPRYAWKNSQVLELGTEDRETPFEAVFALAGIIPTLSLFRLNILQQFMGYDEHFGQHYEDTDFNLQVAIRSKVVYLPLKLVMYRIRPGQSSANINRHTPQLAKLRSKWYSMPNLSEAQLREVRFAEWFVDYPLAAEIGWKACLRELKSGKFITALLFAQGSFRRAVVSRFFRP